MVSQQQPFQDSVENHETFDGQTIVHAMDLWANTNIKHFLIRFSVLKQNLNVQNGLEKDLPLC